MAICFDCTREMSDSVSCTVQTYDIAGAVFARVPNDGTRCHDCAAPPLALHHPGCDTERCPACGGQAISCDCGRDDEEDDEEWWSDDA